MLHYFCIRLHLFSIWLPASAREWHLHACICIAALIFSPGPGGSLSCMFEISPCSNTPDWNDHLVSGICWSQIMTHSSGKHLKHAGQRTARTRAEEHIITGLEKGTFCVQYVLGELLLSKAMCSFFVTDLQNNGRSVGSQLQSQDPVFFFFILCFVGILCQYWIGGLRSWAKEWMTCN